MSLLTDDQTSPFSYYLPLSTVTKCEWYAIYALTLLSDECCYKHWQRLENIKTNQLVQYCLDQYINKKLEIITPNWFVNN